MMNTLKLFNDEKLRKVVGGYHANQDFKVDYEDLKFHFGREIDKYHVDEFIGKKVIVCTKDIFGTDFYVGILEGAKEKYCYIFWSERIIYLTAEDSKNKEMYTAGVTFMCEYV